MGGSPKLRPVEVRRSAEIEMIGEIKLEQAA